MAVGLIAAGAVGKRLSKKGRAKAKDKRAKRQDKRADRKEARAKRLEGRGKAGKAGIVRSKSNTKKLKAGETRRKRDELKKKIKEGKTVGGRIKKLAGKVSDKVKEKGGVKKIAKNLASKTPAGRLAKKIKDNKPKREALKRERQASRTRKKAIRKGEGVTKAAPKKVKIESSSADKMAKKTMKPVVAGSSMYDGPGGQETPKLGSMSDGMSQYGKKPGMGMYGKGSKISYGMGNTVGKPGNAKVGTGVNKNSSAMVQRGNVLKHMARNRKG
jgi:hypothetical protein